MRTWRAREITIAVSLGLHGLIAAAALHSAHEKKQRRATTVAIADEKKKKVEPKKAEPPKPPPPKPAIAKAAPRPAAAPAPAPVTAAPAPVAAAPLQTSISLGNEVGMETGGAKTPDGGRPSDGAKPKPAAAGVKTPIRVAPPAAEQGGEACTEPPGKPEPATKTEIEYTEEARAAGIEGRLVLEVTVDADGNVTAVKVITGV
ncbi:MAG TPA: TonB family protein, partial [Kofleriaceae bacterium]